MKKLFIIGNGFDCYGHGLNTKYIDFRKFLINEYPTCDIEFDGLLEGRIIVDGSEQYDMDELVSSIIRTIDECSLPEWNNLEACLGDAFIKDIATDNQWVYNETNINDDRDDKIFHSIYENECISDSLINGYKKIDYLF